MIRQNISFTIVNKKYMDNKDLTILKLKEELIRLLEKISKINDNPQNNLQISKIIANYDNFKEDLHQKTEELTKLKSELILKEEEINNLKFELQNNLIKVKSKDSCLTLNKQSPSSNFKLKTEFIDNSNYYSSDESLLTAKFNDSNIKLSKRLSQKDIFKRFSNTKRLSSINILNNTNQITQYNSIFQLNNQLTEDLIQNLQSTVEKLKIDGIVSKVNYENRIFVLEENLSMINIKYQTLLNKAAKLNREKQ